MPWDIYSTVKAYSPNIYIYRNRTWIGLVDDMKFTQNIIEIDKLKRKGLCCVISIGLFCVGFSLGHFILT